MKKIKLSLKKTALAAVCAALGGIAARGAVFSFPSPLAAVLSAVLPPVYGASALFGATVSGAFASSFRIIPTAAAGAAALAVRIGSKGLGARRRGFTSAALSASVYMIFSSALCAFYADGASGLLRSAALAAVLFFACAVSGEVVSLWSSASRIPPALLFIACGLSVCALCPSGGGFSFGGAAAAYIVLFSALRFGSGASAAAATVCAFGAALSTPDGFTRFALLGLPAIISSLPAFDSPLRASAVFFAISLPLSLVSGAGAGFIIGLAAGAAAFALTYKRVLRFSEDIFAAEPSLPRSFRAEALGAAARDISERVGGIARLKPSPARKLSDAVYSKVCIGCPKNSACFENGGVAILKLDSLGAFGEEELFKELPDCARISDISRVSRETARRRDYILSRESERKNSAALCSQMLTALEYAVSDAENAVMRSVSADRRLSERLARSLKRSDVRFIRCSVFRDGGVEIAFAESARINEPKLALIAEAVTGAVYSKPERSEIGCGLILRFTPKSEYIFEAGGCQLSAKSDASGDVSLAFDAGKYSYALLSDGMGVGSPARAVSLMLADLLRKLIIAGYSVDTAIRLSSLVITSAAPDESFATLDLLRLDRSTGAAEVYKAGGCRSLLISDGSRSWLRAGGYPVGILGGCDIKVHRFFVKNSASLVMMTDGADLTPEECSEALGSGGELPPSELAAELLERAAGGKEPPKDDISVTVVRIVKRTA